MSDNEHIEFEGTVEKSVRGVLSVRLDHGQIVNAYLSGRMKKNKINVIPGDRVKVKISPYDLTHGIVYYRMK
jgi:translation initiation factor IF-1